MWLLIHRLRPAMTMLVTAALLVLLTGIPLLSCPFLTASHTASQKPCCPRATSSRCPLAPSLDACPYYLSEARLGFGEEAVAGPLMWLDSSPLPTPPALPASRDTVEREDVALARAGPPALLEVLRI